MTFLLCTPSMIGVVCKPGVRANPVLTLLPIVFTAPLHNMQILSTRMD